MPRPECSDDAELATKFSSYFKDKISDIHKTHSKKYHKYITNIPQIYHKSTTKCDIVPQKCDIVLQKCDIVPQKGVVYYKM